MHYRFFYFCLTFSKTNFWASPLCEVCRILYSSSPRTNERVYSSTNYFPPSFYLLIPVSVACSSQGVSLQASLSSITSVYFFLLPLSLCESCLHFLMLTKSCGTRSLRPGNDGVSLLFDVRVFALSFSLRFIDECTQAHFLIRILTQRSPFTFNDPRFLAIDTGVS